MELTVKAYGIEANMGISNYTTYMVITLMHESGLNISRAVSYTESSSSSQPIIHEKIYQAMGNLSEEVNQSQS